MAALLLAGGCATNGAIVFKDPRELAGTWRGRAFGPLGHGIATLVVAEDGAYRGELYLEGEDRPFTGVITVIAPGQARYRGIDGHGEVTLSERNGRVLRFIHDGGGAGATYARAP
jgi:hypothetical protein